MSMYDNVDYDAIETERICKLREKMAAEKRGEEYHDDDDFDPSRDDHWHR